MDRIYIFTSKPCIDVVVLTKTKIYINTAISNNDPFNSHKHILHVLNKDSEIETVLTGRFSVLLESEKESF